MEYGEVKITDEVVETIATIAASQVPGVVELYGGMAYDIIEKIGKKKYSKGIKVEIEKRKVTLYCYIVVDFGSNIIEVAENVQDSVKQQIELMTGLEVEKIDVTVSGIKAPKVESMEQ